MGDYRSPQGQRTRRSCQTHHDATVITPLSRALPRSQAQEVLVRSDVRFDLLYAFLIVRLDRRKLVWINVTTNPTAEWIARQLTDAFPWDEAPRYLIRNREGIYGSLVTRRLRTMRNTPIAPASP